MYAGNESQLIRALKVQLTTVSGYARMLDREIETRESVAKQREYSARLSESLEQLQRLVEEHDTRHAEPGKPGKDNQRRSSTPRESETSLP